MLILLLVVTHMTMQQCGDCIDTIARHFGKNAPQNTFIKRQREKSLRRLMIDLIILLGSYPNELMTASEIS